MEGYGHRALAGAWERVCPGRPVRMGREARVHKHTRRILAGLAAGVLVAGFAQSPAIGAPPPAGDGPERITRPDDLPNPLAAKQRDQKTEAIRALLAGNAKAVDHNGTMGIELPNGRWVQWGTPKTEKALTLLVEFGDETYKDFGAGAGPQKGQIPKPDRNWDGGATDDNSTNWHADTSPAFYQNMLFNPQGPSMTDFYLKQSGGRYTVNGEVQDWVKVRYNEARYGNNDHQTEGYWQLVTDALTAYDDKLKAQGWTDQQIKDYLKPFDQVDRYDYNNNGNVNEPDGYIDHLQIVHAGVGEEAGGGAQGANAIWSHRWRAWQTGIGQWGPGTNKAGGAEIGDSGFWGADYVMEPENGGLGVFCHEFGHELGLPDLYDTSGGDNGTGFWTLMSAGSWLNNGTDTIGTLPGYFGPWEKLFLGWLDQRTVDASRHGTTYEVLGAAGQSFPLDAAVLVKLPDQTITTKFNDPYAGAYEWWGGRGNNLDTSLARDLDLTGATGAAAVTAKAWYDTEQDFDYVFGEVSTDGGSTWSRVGEPISGRSAGWQDLRYDLSAYKGKQVKFRYRYVTDSGTFGPGLFLDNIALSLDGATRWSDDVEAGTTGWTAAGFARLQNGALTEKRPHYYLVENRTYVGYDRYLKTGPYNFGWANSKPQWVERFPFQKGMLVWYVNTAYADNNTNPVAGSGGHPGHGRALPVDAHPTALKFPGGALLGNKRQPFDATFGLHRTDPVTLHRNGAALDIPSRPGVPVFDDTNPNAYYDPANPQNSVIVGGAGVKVEVLSELVQGRFLILKITT